MDIIWTLLAKIKEGNYTSLTAPLVRDMKERFLELSPERIFALFSWTVWRYERSGQHLAADRTSVSADRMKPEEFVVAGSDGGKSRVSHQVSVPDPELDSDWDPMQPTVNRSPGEQSIQQATHVSVAVEGKGTDPPVVRDESVCRHQVVRHVFLNCIARTKKSSTSVIRY